MSKCVKQCQQSTLSGRSFYGINGNTCLWTACSKVASKDLRQLVFKNVVFFFCLFYLFDNSVDFFIDKCCLCDDISSSLVGWTSTTTTTIIIKVKLINLIVCMVIIHLCFQSNLSFEGNVAFMVENVN